MSTRLELPSEALRRPESWGGEAVPGAFGNLESLVRESSEKGIIEDLPASEEAAREEHYASRASVISERLWLLGYLDVSKAKARKLYRTDRAAFLATVERFQGDALLVEDGWVGKKTWSALEELVSFEGLPVTSRWFEHDTLPLAFQRAVQCRLHALGLARETPDRAFDGIDAGARERLCNVLVSLRLCPSTQLQDSAIYRCLLDQDLLSRTIATLAVEDPRQRRRSGGLVFRYFLDPGWDRRAHQRLMRKFILQIAKIELWLLGFDISVDGKDNFPVRHFPHAPGSSSGVVKEALREFYSDLAELSRAAARDLSGEITPEFFRQIVLRDDLEPDAATAPDAERADVAFLLRKFESQEAVDHAIVEGRSLGMRLWDGIKRLYRWFSRLFTRVLQIGKNLVRGFYRYATKGLQVVRRALRAFTGSARVYLDSDWRDARDDWPVVEFRRDLDVCVYAGPQTSAEGKLHAARHLSLFSYRFRFAAGILGLLFEALVAGVLRHWARLARALVECIGDMIPLYRQIQRIEEELLAIEHGATVAA